MVSCFIDFGIDYVLLRVRLGGVVLGSLVRGLALVLGVWCEPGGQG